jgi:uncharacterized membrane protein YhhN
MTTFQRNLFITFAIVFVASTILKPYPLSWLLKLVPIALLIHFSWGKVTQTYEKWFIAGLVFSMLGDFFLDYDRVHWFVFGLGAFLFAHLCYIRCLFPLSFHRWPWISLYALFGLIIFLLLRNHLGELFIPVLIYMSVLLVMGISTLLSDKSNPWLLLGGICFVFSDALIGLDKFYLEIPYASIWIMLSYYLAQFSLMKGIFQLKEKT